MRASILIVSIAVMAGCVGQRQSSAAGSPGPTPTASISVDSISAAAISAGAATATAIEQAGSSTTVKVLAATRSTYGVEAGGGTVAPADTQVWAVRLSGTFQPPSCGPYTPTPHPCPSPATTALILIDARTGAFIQGEMPAP